VYLKAAVILMRVVKQVSDSFVDSRYTFWLPSERRLQYYAFES
jgi:hypothetical protein